MTASAQQRELPPGTMVGVFRIERTLGIGGFGITYLAFDTSLNIQVAVKEYFPQNAWRDTSSRTVHCYAGEAEQTFQIGLQRFHKEGQTLAQFKHPNIVGVRQMLPANNTAYLVMDYEHGEELEAYLRRLGRPLTYQEVENIFNPLLDGLRAVHDRGLLHLDIKPENIFLRADSTPVLIDFGGARHQLGQASRSVSFLVASDGYAPNEQYTGTQLQPTTDIYAVGATLYRSVTGRIPADAPKRGLAMIDGSHDPLVPVRQAVASGAYPEYFLQTLDDALNMRVSSRPQSVRELQQRLFQAARVEPELAPPPQPISPPLPISKHPNKIGWLLALFALTIMSVGIVAWNIANESKKQAEVMQDALLAAQQQVEREKQATLETQRRAEEAKQATIEMQKQLEETASMLEAQKQAELTAKQQTEREKQILKNQQDFEVIDFIKSYIAACSQNDIQSYLNFYSFERPLKYYALEAASYEDVRESIQDHMLKYPRRSIQVITMPKIDWIEEHEVHVAFNISSDLSPEGADTVHRETFISINLVQSDNGWKIAAVSSKKL
ncbi:MAG: protein kinase [Gammaproteobacteria bacterium]|nr:protein kinase [Gammaproteobacteria bacterium]MBU1724982.1 protein kinase [Gammaproteobacteria bacterium]MBU2007092.1 protein kinase [Gammaproteobacteria bacterium]